MPSMGNLTAWWQSLGPTTQERLAAHPRGPVPAELWREVTTHGVAVLGTYWPSTADGPDGYHLPHDVAEFVERQS